MVVYTRIHLVIVSIHTPTQGVTFLYICNVFRICFNPHTHAGCDPKCRTFMKPIIKFQSTHPRRVWLRFRHCLKESLTCFNPHTHAGCDRSGRFTLCCSMDVSIHTPTQGVTTLAAVNSRNPRVSIHTPTQGVTQAEVWKVWHRSFNPHTHAGCDLTKK